MSLPLPQQLRLNLSGVAQGLAEHHELAPARGRWVSAENLHITLKFLGEVSDTDEMAIVRALKAVPPVGAIELRARGIVIRPPRGPARVLAAEFEGDVGRVAQLQAEIERALEELGFARERRPFWPHATLARFRGGFDARDLEESPQQAGHWPGPAGVVDRFALVESLLRTEGPLYVIRASFVLAS